MEKYCRENTTFRCGELTRHFLQKQVSEALVSLSAQEFQHTVANHHFPSCPCWICFSVNCIWRRVSLWVAFLVPSKKTSKFQRTDSSYLEWLLGWAKVIPILQYLDTISGKEGLGRLSLDALSEPPGLLTACHLLLSCSFKLSLYLLRQSPLFLKYSVRVQRIFILNLVWSFMIKFRLMHLFWDECSCFLLC